MATSLFAFATTMRLNHAQVEKEIERAERLGSDIAKIPYAIDKRILLDGVQLAGGWNKNWADTNAVVNTLFKQELIGNANPSCAGAWNPADGNNASMALLPCNFMNAGAIPFRFSASADAVGGPSDSISELKVRFFHANNIDFDEHFHLYPTIIRYASLKSSPQVTGLHSFKLVDKRNNNEITVSTCQQIKTHCAIEAKYSTNNMGLGQDVFLRTNGQNMMHGNIGFAAGGAGRAKCSKVDNAGNMMEADCGISTEIVAGKDEIQSNLTKSFASEYILANNYIESAGALVDVICRDQNNNAEKCGMTVVQSGATALATMKTNNAFANNIDAYGKIRTVRRGGTPLETFSVDANSGNVATEGAVVAKGKIQSTNTAADAINTSGGVVASGKIRSNNTAIDAISTSGGVRTEGQIATYDGPTLRAALLSDGKIYSANTAANAISTAGGISSGGNIVAGNDVAANRDVVANRTLSAGLDITANRNIVAQGTIIARDHLNADLDIVAGRDLSTGGTISATGSIHSIQNIRADGELSAKGRIGTDNYVRIGGVASEGSACAWNGMIGRLNDGTHLSCISGIWKKLGDGGGSGLNSGKPGTMCINGYCQRSSGAVVAFGGYKCSNTYGVVPNGSRGVVTWSGGRYLLSFASYYGCYPYNHGGGAGFFFWTN